MRRIEIHTQSISGLLITLRSIYVTCIFMVQNSSELRGLHMQALTKLDTLMYWQCMVLQT